MISIVVLGAGNIGVNLCHAINSSKNLKLVQWYNRSPIKPDYILKKVSTTNDISKLVNADLYIIAVSDKAIKTISNSIKFSNRLVVHTSGCLSMHELNKKNRPGVLYPLQTISKENLIDFVKVPMCIEAGFDLDKKKLKKVAYELLSPTFFVDCEQRKKLHLSAVFINNFSNQMFRIAHELTDKKNLNFEILKPLILETAIKVQKMTPYNAQTGPAVRGDKKTIKKHLNLLSDQPELKKIYEIITNSIQNTHDKRQL